ncbi:DNA-processing protein DprA [Nocardioides alkalitolerans]|uniref:DNA-processing protein DprA n=1 Tax=Nocardioides alkalitolerans TaxID=281714 RepID=UPI00041991A2|nr:DNA-processing protein DprA [Nocardioides alkalitolerans]
MSVTPRERLARVALSHLAEPGDVRLLRLARTLGPEKVYDALLAERELDGSRSEVAERLVLLEPERRLDEATRLGVRFVVPGDAEWPTQLDDLADAEPAQERGEVPVGLWVRGPLRLDEVARSVAIVGSRAATTYGEQVAGEMAAHAGRHDWTVVSGAAFGIDQAAHRGALAVTGPTVAVMACGVERAYPVKHAPLLALIAERGAIVSEAPVGSAPMRVRFLARNRLIAALTRGTVVVEAAVRSGSLNTAGWADRLHRQVMGVPGPVTSGLSQGVHELIRARSGLLVTRGADVLEVVGAAGVGLLEPLRERPQPRDALTPRQRQVLDAVPVVSGAPIAAIARTAGLGVDATRRDVHELYRVGLVEQTGPGWRLSEQGRL